MAFAPISQDWSICLGSRPVCQEILSLCIGGLQRDHLENPYESDWGVPRDCGHDANYRFHAQRLLDKPQWPTQDPGVGADAQWITVHGSKNLFQRAILYRHKSIFLCQGRLHATPSRNYVYGCDVFFINISGMVNSFGLSSCLPRDIIIVHPWVAAGPSRESIWERLMWRASF